MTRIPPPPHRDDHAASARRKYDRGEAPETLRQLVRWARREYALEGPPLALHEGYTHIVYDGRENRVLSNAFLFGKD